MNTKKKTICSGESRSGYSHRRISADTSIFSRVQNSSVWGLVLANFRPLPQIVPDWQGLYIQEDCLFILVLFVRRCSMLGLLYLFVYNKVFVL